VSASCFADEPDFDARRAAWLSRPAATIGRCGASSLSSSGDRLPPGLSRGWFIDFHGDLMVRRPDDMNAFEFAVLAGLRAAQLHRGCTPRVDRAPKVAVTAQLEVATRKVRPLRAADEPLSLTNDSDPVGSTVEPVLLFDRVVGAGR
jgi:hypothetical protein